ncbi:ribonuclease HII [Desulfuribacillus alkaliarsenatis]|uniref:Ribonuclease HII n=1 Tax=Desulfuribacillus alkaliarsenatis TaxID=766136 RepID=A0A1E5G657_9FIRM|nr:ribonuclease HII [Desulfuribacillus alkaliarsenatis]OEF98575.1 ribonuclease HII [Desulfuribacillus alkaliarsenatis]
MDTVKELLDNLHKYKVREVEERILALPSQDIDKLIEKCRIDERKGIQNIANKYLRKKEKMQLEVARTKELYKWERSLWSQGVATVAGIDEVGRGCVAGPVVAAAVILPMEPMILNLNDSKKLSADQRDRCAEEIRNQAIDYAIGEVSAERIDEIGIVSATFEAMRQALDKLIFTPDYLLVDAFKIPGISIAQKNIIGGDSESASIAAASIIAKVYRDDTMKKYKSEYSEYGFEKHKGYGTPEHMQFIEQYGITPLHRITFLSKKEDREL